MSNIKLGITLYCFTQEYCRGEMTLEDVSARQKKSVQKDMKLLQHRWFRLILM